MARSARKAPDTSRKTRFDTYVQDRLKEPKIAAHHRKVAAKIDAIDKLVQVLDSVRVANGTSKAALARRIGAKPEILRRLFTARSPNPTLSTVIAVMNALGFHLTLVPNRKPTSRRAR